jgi:hypothetical protein
VSGFISVGETLKRQPQRSSSKGVVLILQIGEEFHQLLPDIMSTLADKISIHSYRNGRLSLATPSPVVSQETYLHGEQIRRALNEQLGSEAVKEIRIRIQDTKI